MKKMQVKLVVAGCGYWGKNLIRNFASLGVLGGVCDTNTACAKRFAEEYDVPVCDWDTALKSEDVHAVAIASPAAQHYAMAKAALLAGKHVFVEKPMALDVAHGEELCALAQQKNLTLMVGHLLQYHPAYLKLKFLVDDGVLGQLRYVYSNRLNLGKIRREEDILWSFAPHDISMILDLIGEEPKSVKAHGAYFLSEDVADVTTTHFEFSGGRKAHIFLSWLHPFKEQKLVVVGEKAMAVFNDGEPWASKLQLYRHRVEIDENNIPLAQKAAAETVVLEESEPLLNECTHFIECVQTGQKPKTDGVEGLRVLRVLDTAFQDILQQAPETKKKAVQA